MFRYKKYKKLIEEVINDCCCDLVYFEYNRKVFGNMHVVIRKNGELVEFITDRGEIRNNKGFCIDDSYVSADGKSTFDKLMEVLYEQLPKIRV